MNPRTHADIMTLAPEDAHGDHPFSYARILGVFHCDVVHNNNGTLTTPVPVNFLWVRRFRLDRSFKGGFKRKRLHRIEFLPDSDPDAYGFVDPDEVIRASHLIPAFAHGPTDSVLYTSLARKPDEFDDWRYHYVNLCVICYSFFFLCRASTEPLKNSFVDRDMLMRYLGGGVGHYHVVEVPDEDADEPNLPDDDEDPDPDPASRNFSALLPDDPPLPEDSDSDEELDGEHGEDSKRDSDTESDSEEEEEEEDEEEEEELGPEDGEDGVDDLAAQLGYDEL
jgi:hypothetical protein